MDPLEASARKWTKWYAVVAGINALIAVGWIIPLFLDTRISRTIAGGSVGTWGVLGFELWLIVGVLGFVGFAAMAHITPWATGRRLNDALGWAHLVLMEAGALVTTAMLGYAGYVGGTAMLAGANPGEVHQLIAFLVEPFPLIAVFALVTAVGVAIGVVNLLRCYWRMSFRPVARYETGARSG